MHVLARLEAQDVVSPRVGRKPVVAFDIFAKRLKGWKSLVFLFLQQARRFSPSLDNLKIPVLYPDATLKIPLALLQFFWRYVENIRANLIDLLPVHIFDIIFGQVVRRWNERQHFLNIVEVLLR